LEATKSEGAKLNYEAVSLHKRPVGIQTQDNNGVHRDYETMNTNINQ
jgi:hypothetical protein